jgi:hypothetical protein
MYQFDFVGLTVIFGHLSGCLDASYLSEFKVEVVFVFESKILSAGWMQDSVVSCEIQL